MEIVNYSKNLKAKKINSLMGLRFLFALGIFIHHFDTFSDLNITNYNQYSSLFFEGFIGVNFFYVLSGFIIAYCYMKKMKEQIIKPGEFIYKRIARVWPVHVLTLVIASISYASISVVFSKSGIINIAMLQSFIPIDNYAFGFNGVSWSLSTEMFFYISFCFLVLLPEKYIKTLFAILTGAIVMCLFQGANNIPNASWMFYINPLFRMVDFLAGILIFQLFDKTNKEKISIKNATYLEITSIVLLLIMMYLGTKQTISIYLRWDIYYLVPISILVYVFAIDKGLMSRIIGNKVFVFLGECSFVFYMIHQIVLVKIKQLFSSEITSMTSLFKWGGVALIITIVISIALYYFYEKPANKLMLKLRSKVINNV